MLLERRSRRWSAARPSLSLYHGSTGPGGVAAAIAGGVAGLGFIGQNLHSHVGASVPSSSSTQPQQPSGSDKHNVSNSPNNGSAETQGHSKIIMTAPREIPMFRNRPRIISSSSINTSGVPQRTITVIDEAEASM